MTFEPIGKILPKSAKKSGAGRQIEASSACMRAKDVIDKMVCENKISLNGFCFKKGILTIKASSSVMAQELGLRKGEIMSKINDSLGKEKVKSIQIVG